MDLVVGHHPGNQALVVLLPGNQVQVVLVDPEVHLDLLVRPDLELHNKVRLDPQVHPDLADQLALLDQELPNRVNPDLLDLEHHKVNRDLLVQVHHNKDNNQGQVHQHKPNNLGQELHNKYSNHDLELQLQQLLDSNLVQGLPSKPNRDQEPLFKDNNRGLEHQLLDNNPGQVSHNRLNQDLVPQRNNLGQAHLRPNPDQGRLFKDSNQGQVLQYKVICHKQTNSHFNQSNKERKKILLSKK